MIELAHVRPAVRDGVVEAVDDDEGEPEAGGCCVASGA
jgi:hypothetical protein